jgi:adenosylcobinamide-phosphate synthase
VLENGNDAIFAAIFWFVVLGAPGVVMYRLVNTLDAMWGYKNARYHHFGRAAARLDDVLNYLPARLTALSYAAAGKFCMAIESWRRQAAASESPTAGPVMAAGAGALSLRLGGPAIYHGQWCERPALGYGVKPCAEDIGRAIALVQRAIFIWVVVLAAFEGVWHFA